MELFITEKQIINVVLSRCNYTTYPNVWQLIVHVMASMNYDGDATVDEIAYHVLAIRDKILITKEEQAHSK